MIQFTVIGVPQPAGSKKGFPFRRKNGGIGVAITDANPKAKDWKHAVASAAIAVIDDVPLGDRGLLEGPLSLECKFYFPQPRSHYRTGKNSHLIKLGAPWCPQTRPDSTKLIRAVEDALTSVIWVDDAQVVHQVVDKRYGEPARCEITITELKDFT